MQTTPNLIACLARQLVGWPKKLPPQLETLHKELEPQKEKAKLGGAPKSANYLVQ